MKDYQQADERTPLTKTLPPDYVFMTNPNRMYRKQVHQFQCCICAVVLTIFAVALAITILYSVDEDIIDVPPILPPDNASLQLLLSNSWPLKDDGIPQWQIDPPTPQEVEEVIAVGKSSLAARDKMEAANPSLPVNSPSYRHQVSIKTSARATNMARSAYVMEVATKTFVMNKSKPKNLTKSIGRGPMLSSSWLPTAECGVGPLPACPPSEYRTIDGSCNNAYKPNSWGVAMRPYRRQLASSYADGVSKPRVATDQSPLPSARAVSVTVHRPAYRDDPNFTVMLAVWGQFMDHDVTATALSLGAGGKPISCCQNTSSPVHPECFPVYLSEDDPYYNQFGISCMEFVRSAPAPTCSMGPREQLNQVSSYIDGSVVYGNTPELSRSLRSYQGGQLKMLETADGRTLLPISTNLDDGCNRESENAKGRYCFMSGDTRANENTHLTSLHLLMARQHNLLASQLTDLNPDWNDEKVYQEARKIVAAQMQHITYNEFLPVLLGPDMMDKLDLTPKQTGYYTGYDPSVDATISNNFATSAFRFAHTLLPGLMKSVAKDWGSEESVEMHKMLFDPYKLYQVGALDQVVQGAINTQLERADSYFNTQVTQHLFQAIGEDDKPSAPRYGLDLVSLNVQRGRDHGLPAYPVWREFCGLPRPKTFKDMEGMVDEGSLERIKSLYKSVDDIDMYTGALSEFPIEGGMVGPTITCLVSDQFKRMKQGDSFWYETDKQPQAFSPDQLDEIRKTTLASIICDTADELTTVQPQVMLSVTPTNTRVPCSSVPRPDLTKWAGPVTGLKEGKVKTKYNKVAVTVTSGSITTSSGDVLWDGTVPVNVALPLFSVKKTSAGTTGFGHGVQWQGTVTVASNKIEVSGTFSYPVYTHGPIPLGTNYSIKWVNGEFTLNSEVASSDTDISALTLPGNYESPIYFNEIKVDPKNFKKQFIVSATDDTPLIVGDQILPVILMGSYSPDKTSFYWSGNATITIPISTTPPVLSSPTDLEKSSISGAFNLVSGNLKLDSSDGSTTDLWSGGFPFAIPLPLPYKVLMASGTGEKLIVFGNGLEWSASISGSLLEGSFSFPQYNRTVGMVSVNWFSGQFSLEVVPLTNMTLDKLLTPGVKYTSRIIFREEPALANLQINSVFSTDIEAPDSLENLVVESQEVLDGTIRAPLILHGTFSPDKTKFYFNGKVILAVRPTKPKIYKQLKSLKGPELSFPPWGIPKFGGSVNSGHITAGLNGGDAFTIWSGTVPVAIPAPVFFSPIYDSLDRKSFIFGNGVVWSGSLSGSTIKGTFTLPQSIWSMVGITQRTWTGEFSFELNPLWNTILGNLFIPGAKYYSKIHFQGTKYEPGVSTLNGVPGKDPSVAMTAPIILQGSYSLDKTTFYWTGDFIIAFRNKPSLMFTIPIKPKPSILQKNDSTKPRASIAIDITSGNVVAGLVGATPGQAWSGKFPATIPLAPLLSKDSWRAVPTPNVIWSGDVKDDSFQGTFAVPTYKQNGTSEIVEWWAGNFSFTYTTKYGQLLENYIKAGKKYDFQVIFNQPLQSVEPENLKGQKSENALVDFVEEAKEVLEDSKLGKLILKGNFYSKPFYCSIIPFCTDRKEYYWSGPAILSFPDPPQNKTVKEFKVAANAENVEASGESSQFIGQVVSGSVEGGLKEGSLNTWWSGTLPVRIPTSIFWTNKTVLSSGVMGGHNVEWSGILSGKTMKGTFSFPQLVLDFPVPSVQWWTGQFSFDIEPLWNTSLDGVIKSEVKYSSGVHFQGIKSSAEGFNEVDMNFVEKTDDGSKQMAPIILQGKLSPDGSSFLWSGKFIMSIKSYPVNSNLFLMKSKIKPDNGANSPSDTSKAAPATPPKPKSNVSFMFITGQASVTNGSDPVQIWNGEMPIAINTDMLNPTNTPGAGVAITWSAESIEPQLSGTFSITVYTRKGSVLLPVSWSGNFSIHYLFKWSGSFNSVVSPGKKYTCNLIFKDMVQSVQSESPGYISEPDPKRFVVAASEGSGTPCTMLLNGKSFTKDENPFYCSVVPFMCTKKPITNWFSFNGDTMLIIKPPANIPPEQFILSPAFPPNINVNTDVPRRINATVISGSIEAGPESDYPRSLWSGSIPLNISLPAFWNSEDASNVIYYTEDTVHTHGVIWSGSQMGPRVEGSFSLPQYSKTGVTWWTGRFAFIFQTNWGYLGDLDELILPGVNYNSKIVFRDIHSPAALLAPSQFDIDTSTSLPIILLGTYSPDRKTFYWFGNVIIALRRNTLNFVNKYPNLVSEGSTAAGKWPGKPESRVGLLISSGNVTNSSEGNLLPLWSGSVPVTIPLSKFNISQGVFVLWTVSTIYPTISGNFSIPKYIKNADTFKIEWIDGTFSFNSMTVWNTSMNVIQVGKQYSTIISSSTTQLTKAEQEEMYNSFLSLIMENEQLTGSEIGKLNLNGILSPDNMFFSWLGEAWFYPDKTTGSEKVLKSVSGAPLHASQFGGSVYDGSITAGSSSWFSFARTVWAGNLPIEIPISVFWSRSFFGPAKITRGIIWTATSVTETFLEGSYSIPEITYDGIATSVTWYKGDFKFYIRPLWLSTIGSLIHPGIQYYSRLSFQGGSSPVLESTQAMDGTIPGIRVPIILQGTYSPDRTSFFWSGNFILNVKPPKYPYPQLQSAASPEKLPTKPQEKVGVLISSGSVTNSSEGKLLPLWSGNIPVPIPLADFNISKGVNVIWTASTLYPTFSGNFSIPKYIKKGKTFKIQWTDGTFSFDATPVWNTSLDVIQIGKEYATIMGSDTTKLTKSEDMYDSFLSLITESEEMAGSQLGKVNLKGTFTPDKKFFNWMGEAWFYPDTNKTVGPKKSVQGGPIGSLSTATLFGGTVTGGSVTSKTMSFYSLPDTVWSGELPLDIPFSAFWARPFFWGGKFTRGITWTATSVTDSSLEGSYSVSQMSWAGITYYQGDFKFSIEPLWATTITAVIQPGTQYYSKVSFQGTPTPQLQSTLTADADTTDATETTDVKVPIILQGTYSPDMTSFSWSGNFILAVKPPKIKPPKVKPEKKTV